MKIKLVQITKQIYLTPFVLMLDHCSSDDGKDNLTVHFEGDAKIEVGSQYVGIDMHHSSPLQQRISFYYPVANSIDLSTDYWKIETHYYSGSLLAAHFDLLDNARRNELVQSARENLLDEKVGVYNAFPMDFHRNRENDYAKNL